MPIESALSQPKPSPEKKEDRRRSVQEAIRATQAYLRDAYGDHLRLGVADKSVLNRHIEDELVNDPSVSEVDLANSFIELYHPEIELYTEHAMTRDELNELLASVDRLSVLMAIYDEVRSKNLSGQHEYMNLLNMLGGTGEVVNFMETDEEAEQFIDGVIKDGILDSVLNACDELGISLRQIRKHLPSHLERRQAGRNRPE